MIVNSSGSCSNDVYQARSGGIVVDAIIAAAGTQGGCGGVADERGRVADINDPVTVVLAGGTDRCQIDNR